MEAFDPEGEFPYYYYPDELGQPNYGVLSPTGYGDRDTFYSWLEDSFLRHRPSLAPSAVSTA